LLQRPSDEGRSGLFAHQAVQRRLLRRSTGSGGSVRPPSTPSLPPVPIQEAVAEFMGALLGLGAAASKTTPEDIEPDGDHVVALYLDDLRRPAALVIADLALAAATGAA